VDNHVEVYNVVRDISLSCIFKLPDGFSSVCAEFHIKLFVPGSWLHLEDEFFVGQVQNPVDSLQILSFTGHVLVHPRQSPTRPINRPV
jgi:hypothetical protein